MAKLSISQSQASKVMSSQNLCNKRAPYKGLQNLNQADKQGSWGQAEKTEDEHRSAGYKGRQRQGLSTHHQELGYKQ